MKAPHIFDGNSDRRLNIPKQLMGRGPSRQKHHLLRVDLSEFTILTMVIVPPRTPSINCCVVDQIRTARKLWHSTGSKVRGDENK